MFTRALLAHELEKSIADGYDPIKVAKVAFKIYQDYGLELSPDMDRALLTLMAMEEGKQFELDENEFRLYIHDLRRL